MENFAKFRNMVAIGAISLMLTFGGYIWKAQALQVQQNQQDIVDLKQVVIELKTLVAEQQRFNERIEKRLTPGIAGPGY